MKDSQTATERFSLKGREVHVWPMSVQGPDYVVARFEALLSPGEVARADAFRFAHLRRSYVLTHGALRVLLGCYLSVSPESVLLIHGSHGKPGIVRPGDSSPSFEFNLSHSGGMALFAFGKGCELGVDIERIRPLDDMTKVASRFFSREEAEELITLPPDQREPAFFRCWTRKEAYVKAVGEGLSIPLDSFQVTLRPGEPARFLHLDHDAALARTWMLHDLDVASGYAAALAYCDAPRPVCVRSLLQMDELVDLES